jgi:hypothetical protein
MKTKTLFQDPVSGLYEADGRTFTADQVEVLKKMIPGVQWITVEWVDPPQPAPSKRVFLQLINF